MKGLKACWKVGWRVGVCALLLLWIFHSIFLNEGRLAAQSAGLDWQTLSRAQQWHLAWTNGPRDLWHTLCLTPLWALVSSTLVVGLALFGGVVRWRIVLEAQGLHLPLGRATRISLVAQFFNSFLLGSTGGDLIKAYAAAQETHHKKTEAVTTVFVDRLVGLWAMLLFASLMMPPNYDLLRASRDLAAPALVILAMLAALSVVLGLAFWGGVSKRFPRARHQLRRLPKGELLERALDSPGPQRALGDSGHGAGDRAESAHPGDGLVRHRADHLLHFRAADHPQRTWRAGEFVCADAGGDSGAAHGGAFRLVARFGRGSVLEFGRRSDLHGIARQRASG
jgi:hypothetical protein